MTTFFFDQLFDERYLNKAQKRVLQRILGLDKTLAEDLDQLKSYAEQKDVDIKKLNRLMGKEIDDVFEYNKLLRKLMTKEYAEFDLDVGEPLNVFLDLMQALGHYYDHIKKTDTFFDENSRQKILTVIEEIHEELQKLLYDEGEKGLLEVKEVFEREVMHKGTIFSKSVTDIHTLNEVNKSWERQKMALTQKIQPLVRKLKELEKIIHAGFNKKKDWSLNLDKLLLQQIGQARTASDLVEDIKGRSLTEKEKKEIAGAINKIAETENEIQVFFEDNKVSAAIAVRTASLSGAERTGFISVTNQLKLPQKKGAVPPLLFWLGEQRALGFLKKGLFEDLGTLLDSGLLDYSEGWLHLRRRALKQIVKMGVIEGAHQDILQILTEYKGIFEEAAGHMIERMHVAKRIFGHLAAAMYKIEKEIEEARNKIDQVIGTRRKAEEEKLSQAMRAKQPEIVASQKKTIERMKEAIKHTDEATAAAEKAIESSKSASVADATTVIQNERTKRKKVETRYSRFRMALNTILAGLMLTTSTIAGAKVEKLELGKEGTSFKIPGGVIYQEVIKKEAQDAKIEIEVFIKEMEEVMGTFKADFAYASFNKILNRQDFLQTLGHRLDVIARFTQEHPEASLEIALAGWTCLVGPEGGNLKLSKNRNEAVKPLILTGLKTRGVDTSRVTFSEQALGEVPVETLRERIALDANAYGRLTAEQEESLRKNFNFDDEQIESLEKVRKRYYKAKGKLSYAELLKYEQKALAGQLNYYKNRLQALLRIDRTAIAIIKVKYKEMDYNVKYIEATPQEAELIPMMVPETAFSVPPSKMYELAEGEKAVLHSLPSIKYHPFVKDLPRTMKIDYKGRAPVMKSKMGKQKRGQGPVRRAAPGSGRRG